jgi:hypothetical protein
MPDNGFHEDAHGLLCAGLRTPPRISADDTCVRPHTRSGFCTQMSYDCRIWFGTGSSKDRPNFVNELRADHTVVFVLNGKRCPAPTWLFQG